MFPPSAVDTFVDAPYPAFAADDLERICDYIGTDVITSTEVVPLLFEACPGVQGRWHDHLAEWGGEERGAYNDVNVFARHIVESYAAGNTSEFDSFFALIERILEEGDKEARALAAIGVLEDIQTIATHHPFGPDVFIPWLGRKSRQRWREIDKLWHAAGGTLSGVLRLERELMTVSSHRKWWQFWKRSV